MKQYSISGNEQDGFVLTYNKGENIIKRIDKEDYEKYANKITKVILPDSAEVLNHSCFYCFSRLEEVVFSHNLIAIQDNTFFACQNLKKFDFGNKLQVIEDSAFCKCGLESIVLPNSVKYLGNSVFCNNPNLISVKLHSNLNIIPDNAFCKCANLKSINIPESVFTIGYDAFRDCKSLTEINLPDNLLRICRNAFCGCSELRFIQIPKLVSELDECFCYCSNLQKVEFLNPHMFLDGTFKDCYNLQLDNTYIEQYTYKTFRNCKKIKDIKSSEDSFASFGGWNYQIVCEDTYYPRCDFFISNSPDNPIEQKYENNGEWHTLYEIKENQLILYLPDTNFPIQTQILTFIKNPTYENFSDIKGTQHKELLAVAYFDHDKRFKTYVKNHLSDILQYAGETEDFSLATFIIDNNLISSRTIDKCLDLVSKGEYSQLFIMLMEYKSEMGAYEKRNNEKRFDL